MEIVQMKIMNQSRATGTITTMLHLLLEFKPDRFLIKAEIKVDELENIVQSITYKIDEKIFKTIYFRADFDGSRKKELDKFIMEVLNQIAEK